MVPQDVPQLQLAAAAAEALPRTGGGAGLQQLAGRAQAGAGRREPADGGRAPPGAPAALRVRRAPGRGNKRRTKLRNGKEMKTLRAHGFNQRPRFEQVVGYLDEPLPLDQPDRKATSFITSHFYLDDFAQSSEDPNPRPLQRTPLGRLPHSRRGHGRGLGADAPRRKPLRRRPCRRPGGRRADEQRSSRAVCAARPTALRRQRTLWAQEQQGSRRCRPSAPSSLRTQRSTCA